MVLKTAVSLVALTFAGWALASRYLPVTNHAVLITAALSPYLVLCGLVAVVLLIMDRQWVFATVATALTAAMLAVEIPLYLRSDDVAPDAIAVRVLTANLRDGLADPGRLVKTAEAQADVLGFQELTPGAVERLSAAGLDATFRYRWLEPRRGASGVGLWSRFPLHANEKIATYTMAFVSARIRVAGISIDPSVLVVHLPGPWPQAIDGWRHDIDRLPATLTEVADATGGGAVVVAGDLNSTTDMRPFRGLLRNGYRDAAEQSGSGITPTFPADSWLPPFVAIDHVLTHGCTATLLHSIEIPGSDHRGLVTTVMIPPSP
ncbi:endonuclease/exonuclease/phosphatase family protein [Mycolicibacterium boenickei]|nr:endonuclease/exonuclease/phosphatase family protein [Mycolicibacterium boenickei]